MADRPEITRKLTTFDYLLNRMEFAATSPKPAERGYAKARNDVLGYVRALRTLAESRDALLVAYRTGLSRRAVPAIDRIREAQEKLAAYDASVVSSDSVPPTPGARD